MKREMKQGEDNEEDGSSPKSSKRYLKSISEDDNKKMMMKLQKVKIVYKLFTIIHNFNIPNRADF